MPEPTAREIKCIRPRRNNTHDTKLKLQSAHNSVAVRQKRREEEKKYMRFAVEPGE